MKVGVLGTGFGAQHAEIYAQMPGVEEIFVFGRNREKLEALGERLCVRVTTDAMEIITNPDIELIDVCMPTELHAEYAIKALEHGKHVFVETPVASSADEADRMREASERTGKKLMVDLFLRFEIPYAMAVDMARGGKYGAVKRVQIHRNTAPIWGDLSLPNIVIALMMHDIDFVSWLLGTPLDTRVSAVSGKAGQSAATALLNYKDAYAEITASSMMPEGYPFSMAYEVIYENAVLSFAHSFTEPEGGWSVTLFADGKSTIIPIDIEEAYTRAIRYTLKAIASPEKPLNDVSEAIRSLKMAEEINRGLQRITDK